MLFKSELIPRIFFIFLSMYFCFKSYYRSTDKLALNEISLESECSVASEGKFLTSSDYSGRLGNMVFRFASLYGIGRSIGRNIYVSDVANNEISIVREFFQIFPHISKKIEYKSTSCHNVERTVKYALDPGIYDPPSNLNQYNESKYIRIEGTYLQSYKYFENYKDDLKQLMKCYNNKNEKAKIESAKMWRDEKETHKLCVHVRRDDFLQYDVLLETREDFLIPAIEYICSKIIRETHRNASLLIFGDDYNFINGLILPNMFASVNTFQNITDSSRGFEMCYSIEYCDTYLLSASSSTFGWLIGYLMKSNGTVYYNAEIARNKTYTKYANSNDAFPPYWRKLNVTSDNIVTEG